MIRLYSAIHVGAGKYVTEDKSRTDTTKTKDNPEKANNKKHSKRKLASFSRFLLGQETRWAYSMMLPLVHTAWSTSSKRTLLLVAG